MPAIARIWISFAAIGTGLIHLALVIGAPLGLAIPLAAVGVMEFGWGVLAFTRDTLPTPRAAMVFAIVPLVSWGLLAAAASSLHIPTLASVMDVVPWGVAAIFELFVASTLSLHARRVREGRPVARNSPGVARYLTALVVGGLVVFALTTPALAATEAGVYAQPRGEDDGSFTPQRDTPSGENVDDLFTIPGHDGH